MSTESVAGHGHTPANHAKAKEKSILLGLLIGIFGLLTGIVAAIIANSVTLESEVGCQRVR